LDLAKGTILGLTKACLKGLAVIPMLTDAEKWDNGHYELYAKILGFSEDSVRLRGRPFDCGKRRDYFRDAAKVIPSDFDVFLDPDTGFSKNGPAQKSVRPSDIDDLLKDDSHRVLAIYSHRRERGGTLRENLANTLNGRCPFLAYRGTPGAMIFLSKDCKRLTALHRCLGHYLRPMDNERLITPCDSYAPRPRTARLYPARRPGRRRVN
jgi:hypothetical protein